MNKKILIGIFLICLIFLLFFSPTWCNGVAYYRGVRGCSTDDNNQRNNNQRNNRVTDKSHYMFGNLINY